METKTCSLTDEEIKAVIASHAVRMLNQPNLENYEIEEHIDRMNYLNKRLNARPKEEAPKGVPVNPEPTKVTTSW